MGDDGNQNAHMQDADTVARLVEHLYPAFQVKRVMWDAYTRESSATGNRYPDVERLIKQQMQQGALIMNYCGHGRADAISHEYVLKLADFQNSSTRLPLWLTASCDIMPFDGQEENIGETALFNKKGGAVAFFGTTRTVYQSYNRQMNLAFTKYVLSRGDTVRGQLHKDTFYGCIETPTGDGKAFVVRKPLNRLLDRAGAGNPDAFKKTR